MLRLMKCNTKHSCCRCKTFKTVKDFGKIFTFKDPEAESSKEDKNHMCIYCFKRYIRAEVRGSEIDSIKILDYSPLGAGEIDKDDRVCILCGSDTTYTQGNKQLWYKADNIDRKYKENSFLCHSCYRRARRHNMR